MRLKKNRNFPPIWPITDGNELAFCSATVVYTFGHTVPTATCLSFMKFIGPDWKLLNVEKSTKIVTKIKDEKKKISNKNKDCLNFGLDTVLIKLDNISFLLINTR